MATVKVISDYCKLALPFAAAFYAGLCAYIDLHRGWKLAATLLLTGYLLWSGVSGLMRWFA